jgi:hypothetical protein
MAKSFMTVIPGESRIILLGPPSLVQALIKLIDDDDSLVVFEKLAADLDAIEYWLREECGASPEEYSDMADIVAQACKIINDLCDIKKM